MFSSLFITTLLSFSSAIGSFSSNRVSSLSNGVNVNVVDSSYNGYSCDHLGITNPSNQQLDFIVNTGSLLPTLTSTQSLVSQRDLFTINIKTPLSYTRYNSTIKELIYARSGVGAAVDIVYQYVDYSVTPSVVRVLKSYSVNVVSLIPFGEGYSGWNCDEFAYSDTNQWVNPTGSNDFFDFEFSRKPSCNVFNITLYDILSNPNVVSGYEITLNSYVRQLYWTGNYRYQDVPYFFVPTNSSSNVIRYMVQFYTNSVGKNAILYKNVGGVNIEINRWTDEAVEIDLPEVCYVSEVRTYSFYPYFVSLSDSDVMEAYYGKGYSDGYNIGYSDGVASTGQWESSWSWFASSITAFSSVFAIAIFPGITLGTLCFLPLVISLILLIMKFTKKG